MFKIRTPLISDLKKLLQLNSSSINLKTLNTQSASNQFFYTVQNFIPPGLRFLPSIHIAVEEKNIIGFVILRCSSKPNNCWQIDEVFVMDKNRNSGIGEELVRYVLSVYGSHGIEHFLAEVDSENFPALSLFHQCGFRRYAKVYLYEKEFNLKELESAKQLDKDFLIRTQTNNDLNEILKVELSSIPPDLRPALGHSKDYFKQKKNGVVLIDRSRDLIVGWGNIETFENNNNLIELITNQGWTHLYEPFLSTLISNINFNNSQQKTRVKAIDYITDLTEILTKSGFLQVEVKEVLVRTIWQKAKERKTKAAQFSIPRTAPT